MSLKKAIATFTKENGETVTRHFGIKTVVFHYQEARIETVYEVYPSAAAKLRGAQPEYISQSAAVDFGNMEDVMMILSVSARIWEKNAASPFIEDFSDVDAGTGLQVRSRKSFADLNAEIIDVPFE